jgi:hypothetical protein
MSVRETQCSMAYSHSSFNESDDLEAIMKIETRLHAEHQLDQLAGHFEHWRQTRTHPRQRIPQELWDQAVALTTALPPSRVAKHLRLGAADLKKHLAAHQESIEAAPPTTVGFVEVSPAPSWQKPTPAMQIELHRADGTRLHIHYREATPPLAALLRVFLEAR